MVACDFEAPARISRAPNEQPFWSGFRPCGMLGDNLESIQLDTVLASEEPAGEFVDSGAFSANRTRPALGRIVTIAECHANRERIRLDCRCDEHADGRQHASAAPVG